MLICLRGEIAPINMTAQGYTEYKRREFCKDIQCPIQLELNKQKEGSAEHEATRQRCSKSCLHTTWEFHHWLIEKGYFIIIDSQLRNNQATVLTNINKDLIDWMDKQVKANKYVDKGKLIEAAIERLKQNIL
jgi:hypothetical protein